MQTIAAAIAACKVVDLVSKASDLDEEAGEPDATSTPKTVPKKRRRPATDTSDNTDAEQSDVSAKKKRRASAAGTNDPGESEHSERETLDEFLQLDEEAQKDRQSHKDKMAVHKETFQVKSTPPGRQTHHPCRQD